jgi:hypothetical protein
MERLAERSRVVLLLASCPCSEFPNDLDDETEIIDPFLEGAEANMTFFFEEVVVSMISDGLALSSELVDDMGDELSDDDAGVDVSVRAENLLDDLSSFKSSLDEIGA